jgi:phage FluMu protein Com
MSQNLDPDFVFFRGAANGLDYACGGCHKVLIHGVSLSQIVNVVLQCPKCKAFNDTAPALYSPNNAAGPWNRISARDGTKSSQTDTQSRSEVSNNSSIYKVAMSMQKNDHESKPVPGNPKILDLSKMPKHQNKPNADGPGCYDLVFRRPRADVTPGGEVEVAIYITGYGNISGAKLYFVPPTNFLDPDGCYVDFGLNMRADNLGHFGATRQEIAGESFTIDLSSGGLQAPGWSGPSLFFDDNIGIATESATRDIESGAPEPPVKFTLSVKEKIASGDHDLNFVLTYFNGREWVIAYRTASLRVPTLYERHAGWAWSIGTVIAVIATAATILGLIKAL